jgi:hypothetical protein
MATEDILKALHKLPESPWPELKKPQHGSGNTQQLAGKLAKQLKPFVRPRPIRTYYGAVVRGYLRADLDPVWAQYLPAAEPPEQPVPEAATPVTPATSQATATSGVAPVAPVAGEPQPSEEPHSNTCSSLKCFLCGEDGGVPYDESELPLCDGCADHTESCRDDDCDCRERLAEWEPATDDADPEA